MFCTALNSSHCLKNIRETAMYIVTVNRYNSASGSLLLDVHFGWQHVQDNSATVGKLFCMGVKLGR